MTQAQLDRAIAATTGEPIATVQNLGFSLLSPRRDTSEPGDLCLALDCPFCDRPVPYPGRCPHIHFKIKRGDRELLVTQLFITGHTGNARDGIYRSVGGIVERELVTVDFRRIPDSRIVECRANFDIVLGVTPDERDDGKKSRK